MATPFNIMYILIGLAIGIVAGYIIARIVLRPRLDVAERERARLEQQNAALAGQLRESAHAEALEEKISLKFENLANRIFDEKTEKFKKESQEGLGTLLTPLRERLQEFQKKIDDSFSQQAREQISLKEEIKHIVSVNEKMTQQTESLTKALKGDVKAQGNWGEVILEKILEGSGLRKDIEYKTQGANMGLRHVEEGTISKPDVIILLPEDKHIIVDAKVSLTAYERYCAADNPAEKAQHLKEHLLSIRAQVNRLVEARYQDNEKLGTPDFVLMFMPIEGAYSLAMQEDPQLHSFAWEKKIVIVCPSTLFATLKTIESVWRLEKQNRNAQEIALRGSRLYDKVVGFVEEMQDLGKKITATQKTYDDAFKKLSQGSGNIVRQTEELKALGVKASKNMPKELVEETNTLDFKKAENS